VGLAFDVWNQQLWFPRQRWRDTVDRTVPVRRNLLGTVPARDLSLAGVQISSQTGIVTEADQSPFIREWVDDAQPPPLDDAVRYIPGRCKWLLPIVLDIEGVERADEGLVCPGCHADAHLASGRFESGQLLLQTAHQRELSGRLQDP